MKAVDDVLARRRPWGLLEGDAAALLPLLPANVVDALVTDPPAGISFDNREWDGDRGGRAQWVAWLSGILGSAARALKPGSHALVWSIPRTAHWTAWALEDAGFEIRDCVQHWFGQGFPKSHDVSRAIDRRRDWAALHRFQSTVKEARRLLGMSQSEAARRMGMIPEDERLGGGGYMWFETGRRLPTREEWPRLKAVLGLGTEFDRAFEAAAREVMGTRRAHHGWVNGGEAQDIEVTAPTSIEGARWQGWGTALKPASEIWWLARKPLDRSAAANGSVAGNVFTYGTGALNIEGCRPAGGRWPSNLVLSHSPDCAVACAPGCPIAELDQQAGVRKSNGRKAGKRKGMGYGGGRGDVAPAITSSAGSASRFFPVFPFAGAGFLYCPKVKTKEKQGAGVLDGNHHPTVKSVQLMSWLIRLITPPGGLVLDPFCGSGTTLLAAVKGGWRAIGIEQDPGYADLIRRRLYRRLLGPPEPRPRRRFTGELKP